MSILIFSKSEKSGLQTFALDGGISKGIRLFLKDSGLHFHEFSNIIFCEKYHDVTPGVRNK